jgi:hypothetical protein
VDRNYGMHKEKGWAKNYGRRGANDIRIYIRKTTKIN